MYEYIQERDIESIPFEVGRVYPRIAYQRHQDSFISALLLFHLVSWLERTCHRIEGKGSSAGSKEYWYVSRRILLATRNQNNYLTPPLESVQAELG